MDGTESSRPNRTKFDRFLEDHVGNHIKSHNELNKIFSTFPTFAKSGLVKKLATAP